jgi:signal transduction histidine kinase
MRLRTQLTILYVGPFALSGLALLSIPLLGSSQSAPAGSAPEAVPRLQEHSDRLLGSSAAGFAVMILVSVVVGWLVAGRFLRPVRSIIATARAISASNLDRRLDLNRRDDELKALAETLNDLFARLQAAFESQRHFVANAAHELRTPLTAERTLLQVALADPAATVDSLRAACLEVLDLGRGQERLIDALLTLATGEQGVEHREPCDLAAIAQSVVDSRDPGPLTLAVELAPAVVTGDPRLIESLVANLVDNAIRHNVPAGSVSVATAGSTLTVTNTGPVIPPSEVERLFRPFQRLDGTRLARTEGHGLGLAIVRAIATAHHATIVPTARPAGGLEVRVTW